MKGKVYTIFLGFFIVAILASVPVFADAPDIDLSPIGTVYVSVFPSTIYLPLTIYHASIGDSGGNVQLKALHDFVVSVSTDGINFAPLFAMVDTPFKEDGGFNICDPAIKFPSPGGCVISDAYHATVTVPWTVNAAGNYFLKAEIRHRGNENDLDMEFATVILQIIVVEYPAPPAVANAYLNTGVVPKKNLSGSVRGCIISHIAENHGKDEKYGPKGGPYDISSIQNDALDYYDTICRP